MQEHIRRAHPEHYISKLPATEESFLLMINTPPSERPPAQQSSVPNGPLRTGHADHGKIYPHEHNSFFRDGSSAPGTPRNMDDYQGGSLLPAASAAAALAQLHNHKIEPDWESEVVSFSHLVQPSGACLSNLILLQDWMSDTERRRIPRSSIELPPIQLNNSDVTSEPFPTLNSGRQRDILPSILSNSPPGRSSTLPPLQRPLGPTRPRKQSVTKNRSQHKKQKSKGSAADWLKRGKINIAEDLLRPGSSDRTRPYSAEPSARSPWEDLIDAAASATEDIDEDRTPVSHLMNLRRVAFGLHCDQVPQSPISIHRASLPPFPHQHFSQNHYQASPLQQALTPPPYINEAPDPFPSVESQESGENFHIESRGLSDSSPSYSSQNTQIYCAACQGISLLKDSYACTECICGLCQACVDVLMAEQGARRKCPRCATIGGRFKPFQLDIR